MAVDITALYCCLDDFCKLLADWEAHRLLPSEQTRQRPGKLSRAEMLFIVVTSRRSSTSRHSIATGSASSIAPALVICRTMTVLSA
jgi:hypothetical protein